MKLLATSERGVNPGGILNEDGGAAPGLEAPDKDAELSPKSEAQRKALADAMGVDIEDAPERDDLSDDERAAANPSVASGQLSGDVPGEGSGDSNDGSPDESEASDGLSAAEAEEAFVEASKAGAKAPAKRSRKAK